MLTSNTKAADDQGPRPAKSSRTAKPSCIQDFQGKVSTKGLARTSKATMSARVFFIG